VPQADRQLSVTWVGHSTVLVEAGGVRLLTDPLLRPRVAHLRRIVPPARVDGALDAVLISHAHYDHLDVPSLRRLETRQVVGPRGTRRLLERRGLGPVVELDESEELAVGTVMVRATHAVHTTRRLHRETPSLGYVIADGASVYFPGDTDLFDGMRALAPLDVALMPVWGWGPKLGPGHLDPRRAAEALRLLEPRLAIPIHWGTYRRFGLRENDASLREPAEAFRRLAAELAPGVDVRILAPGERLPVAPG
jgi:L-ascorbate metabolism protein UlaG (beta-lactamase superfamily)